MPYRTYILDVLVKTCWRYLVKVILIGLGERSPEADIVVRNNVSLTAYISKHLRSGQEIEIPQVPITFLSHDPVGLVKY